MVAGECGGMGVEGGVGSGKHPPVCSPWLSLGLSSAPPSKLQNDASREVLCRSLRSQGVDLEGRRSRLQGSLI